MPIFYLAGDILVPGVVAVEADTLDEAVDKAEDQNHFQIFDMDQSESGFKWSGECVDKEP